MSNSIFDVGRMVKRERIGQGMTQDEFARQLGVQQAYVVRVEKGQALPSIRLLQRAASIFGKELLPPKLIF